MDSEGFSGTPPPADLDLYGLLELEKNASQAEIRKAYHKAARRDHPDKAAPADRPAAEVKFKAVSQAYEILSDEQKRAVYDQHGMAGFDPSRGGGGMGEGDINDILSQMFGMNMGGMGGGGPPRPRRSPDEEQAYKVTLEDLYKGKTVKFAANKRVICEPCNGTGARDKSKPQACDRCRGQGTQEGLRQVGPGLMTRQTVICSQCKGAGNYYSKEKDRCKKCKGKRVVEETKALEIYVPRGALHGERITLEGEADQHPGQEPGDLVFTLSEEPHDVFTRIGHDLSADLVVTLAEALGGFSRVVLKHLDGRGLHINHPRGKVLRPNEVLKVEGEGMPLKRGEEKGDLYLLVKIEFPEDGWITADDEYAVVERLLPPPEPPIVADEVDEVEYESGADIEEMGANSGDPRFQSEWEDDDEAGGGPQCAQQ